MKDGVYLLILPEEDFATPVTLKNVTNPDGTPFQILACVDGVRLVSDLQPGYKLIPMTALTFDRMGALQVAANLLETYPADSPESEALDHINAMLMSYDEETQDERTR